MGINTKDIISAAVSHLKEPSMERAEEATRSLAERYQITLEAAGWDLEVAYPYPSSTHHSSADFHAMKARRNMAQRLSKYDTERNGVSRRPRTPNYRIWDPEGVEALVVQAREQAAHQYDAFVAKLVDKVEADGPVVEAILTGEHVWGHSILTVCHADGTTHQWRTEMIINVSKLGTLFNQWPTRKLKPAKRKAV